MDDPKYEMLIRPGNEEALNAEPRVIAALMRDPARRRISSNLTASHFGTPEHATAFDIVLSSLEVLEALPSLSVKEQAREVGTALEAAGIILKPYLLVNEPVINIHREAARVIRGYHLRRAWEATTRAAFLAHLTRAENAIKRAAGASEGITHIGELYDRAWKVIEDRADGKEKAIPLPWPSVASALNGGLWPGLYVLVGGTGSGKTQFALQAGLHAARKDFPVLYIALELDKVHALTRLVGVLQNHQWSKFLYPSTDPENQYRKFLDASNEVKSLPMHMEAAPSYGWDYEQLYASAETFKTKHSPDGPFLMVVDYLQIISGGDRREDQRQIIGQAAYRARAVARDLDAAVILISSTSRGKYDDIIDADKGGNLVRASSLVGTGKESGEIEYSADGVLVIAQDKLAIAKARAARSGWVDGLKFNGNMFNEESASFRADNDSDGAAPGAPPKRRIS